MPWKNQGLQILTLQFPACMDGRQLIHSLSGFLSHICYYLFGLGKYPHLRKHINWDSTGAVVKTSNHSTAIYDYLNPQGYGSWSCLLQLPTLRPNGPWSRRSEVGLHNPWKTKTRFIRLSCCRSQSNNSTLDTLWKISMIFVGISYAVCVSYSRVYLVYHTTSQVMWGLAIGCLNAFMWFGLTQVSTILAISSYCNWWNSRNYWIRHPADSNDYIYDIVQARPRFSAHNMACMSKGAH